MESNALDSVILSYVWELRGVAGVGAGCNSAGCSSWISRLEIISCVLECVGCAGCECGACCGICESGICESGVCESGVCESGVCVGLGGLWGCFFGACVKSA